MSDSALLVIDVQLGMFDPGECVHGAEDFLSTLSELLNRARASDVIIVYIQHCGSEASGLAEGSPGWPIHPAVSPSEDDWVMSKKEPDSFHKTDLHTRLQEKGISRLIVTGIATQFCVDTTVRSAFHLGYKVELAADCHTTWADGDLSARQIIDHHNRTLQRFAVVKSAGDVEF